MATAASSLVNEALRLGNTLSPALGTAPFSAAVASVAPAGTAVASDGFFSFFELFFISLERLRATASSEQDEDPSYTEEDFDLTGFLRLVWTGDLSRSSLERVVMILLGASSGTDEDVGSIIPLLEFLCSLEIASA